MRGVAYARQFARRIFQRLGAADYTVYDPDDYGYVTYEGQGYVIRGGNHLAGTHIMGTDRRRLRRRRRPALVGPREPLPRRRRQHAVDRHVEHHADDRRAVLPERGADPRQLRAETAAARRSAA